MTNISNTGPWKVTPTSSEDVVLGYIIHDGRGGRAVRYITVTPTISQPNNPPVSPGSLSLGDLEVSSSTVITSAQLLAGVTDLDGDTLSVSDLVVVSGSATIDGSDPWSLTPTAAGAGSATATIVDGNGGSVDRSVSWTGIAEAPTIPTISSVTGTIADGSTITVSGSGLGQATTLLRIKGDEGAVGTSVATAVGMTVHGSTGNEWLFDSDGTMFADMQTASPKTAYKWFGGTAYKDLFLYYERQYFDVGPLNPDGNGQIKEVRFAGADVAGEHTDEPALGSGWNVPNEQVWRYSGFSGQSGIGAATRAIMQEWSSQIVAGRIVGTDVFADFEIYAAGWTNRQVNFGGAVNDPTGWGQLFLPFYRSPNFSVSMRMRNLVARAGRQRLEIRNSSNPELANRVVVLHANDLDVTPTEIQVKLDLTRFTATDGLYLFAVNANGEYSAAHQLRAPVVESYNPLTDNYGVIRPTHNGSGSDFVVPDYSTAALAADSLRYQIGFVVDGLEAGGVGKPIGIVLSSHTTPYRGFLRIDHITGDVSIISMVNNGKLTIATGTNFHTELGVRRDWELVIPKNTGEMITLADMQTGMLIGSVARTVAFDGYYPTKWMVGNLLAAGGSLQGRIAYLRCFAITDGDESTVFDFRLTESQAGQTSVPSAHDSGVIGAVGAILTWGAVASPNQAPIAPTLDLGDLTVDTGFVVSSAELLAGATDADGDTLTVTSVTAVSGGTVTGTGPWTITPTAKGAGSATVVISDGTASVNRTVTWNGVEEVTGLEYSRLLDYQGVYRPTVNSVSSYITVPEFTYDPAVDTVEFEIGAQCYSNNPYSVSTDEENTITRSTSNTYRAKFVRGVEGEVKINSMASSVFVTIGPAGTWPLGEACRFNLVLSPTLLSLYKMDATGGYQFVNSVARGGFTVFPAFRLLGTGSGFHGTLFYYAAKKNGVQQFDFRFDEMSFIGTTMRSAHDSSVTATLTGTSLSWRDETPESIAPQPDLVISGSLTHGSTVTITSPTLTFTGGMPQAQLYDDMVGRSGEVGTAATIGSFTTLATEMGSPTPTYKTGGPGGRPYVLRRDGATGERFVRHWVPGFDFKEVFVSRLLRVPTGYAWPGATNADGPWPVINTIPSDSTWKDEWALHADDAGDSGSDLVLGSHSGSYYWSHSGNTPHQLNGAAVSQKFDLRQVHSLGEWNHVDGFARHNDDVPTQGLHVMNYCSSKAKNAQHVALGSVLAEVRGFNQFRMILDGAYVQPNSLCRAEAAEIYLAVGPNAACRVVLGNSVRWEYCTKKGTCPPASWASGSVTARVGLGQLDPDTDPVYVYVVGPDGTPLWPYGKRWLAA